jgi:flavin-dependent thymidylate synthase
MPYNNQNLVALIGYYGGDETHCLSAWQSTCLDNVDSLSSLYQQSVEDKVEENTWIHSLFEDAKANRKRSPKELLFYLAGAGHHTPFEKSTLHFQVRADIASHIHFLKHRIGVSINTESARYKELPDKWYLPSDWAAFDVTEIHLADDVSKDLAEYPDFNQSGDIIDLLNSYAELGHKLYHLTCERLTPVVGRKRAKECSRYFLPYCKQLDFDVTFNFRSFVHFQRLRNAPNAQLEIQKIAQMMLSLVECIPNNPFQLSLEAFGLTDTNSPVV